MHKKPLRRAHFSGKVTEHRFKILSEKMGKLNRNRISDLPHTLGPRPMKSELVRESL